MQSCNELFHSKAKGSEAASGKSKSYLKKTSSEKKIEKLEAELEAEKSEEEKQFELLLNPDITQGVVSLQNLRKEDLYVTGFMNVHTEAWVHFLLFYATVPLATTVYLNWRKAKQEGGEDGDGDRTDT